MSFKQILVIFLLTASTYTFAADTAAKEDTASLPAEGALSMDQIPPITQAAKQIPPQPITTNPTTATPTPPPQGDVNMSPDNMPQNNPPPPLKPAINPNTAP